MQPADDELFFADAESSLEEADFYIFGVRFDGTCSHRKGCAKGPQAIRGESYNFETFNPEHGVDLEEVHIFDGGDVVSKNQDLVFKGVGEKTQEALNNGCFPILIGGEHSATIGAVKALKEKHPDLFFLHIDAHLDFRQEYEGNPNSHACILRRVVQDVLGPSDIAAVGIRSYCREEARSLEEQPLNIFTAKKMQDPSYLQELKAAIGNRPLYVSLDMDAIDPAYAPGVGNPEPFGIGPSKVKTLLFELKQNIVAFDCMEVNPEFDNGNTAALAARLIREVIALKSL